MIFILWFLCVLIYDTREWVNTLIPCYMFSTEQNGKLLLIFVAQSKHSIWTMNFLSSTHGDDAQESSASRRARTTIQKSSSIDVWLRRLPQVRLWVVCAVCYSGSRISNRQMCVDAMSVALVTITLLPQGVSNWPGDYSEFIRFY